MLTVTPAIDGTPTGNPSVESSDPFASQRETSNDPFAADKSNEEAIANDDVEGLSPPPEGGKARRMSKEWGTMHSTPPPLHQSENAAANHHM